MSAVSDQLLVVAILAYVVTMLLSAAEYAFGARGVVARAAVREPELVAVGGGASAPRDLEGLGSSQRLKSSRSLASPAAFGRASVIAMVLGVVAHLGCVVTRGIAADRVTWGNMYEFVLSVTLVGAIAWLVVLWRQPVLRHLGLYVALALVLLLGLDGMVLYTAVTPLVPALNSYWLLVHVTAAVLASGVFLVGFVTAALYLVRAGYESGKRRFPYSLGRRLPTSASLEPLAFRLHAFAFPIWTFAVIAGAIWAEAAWGRYWGWDPKETWAFISWVVYAGYLHARATPSVKRPVATWIAVFGWATMLMNLFGVNIFFVGFHSYAGVG